MATISEPRIRAEVGERRILLHDVSWAGYLALLEIIGDNMPRITYDRGEVELMSPLSHHERYAVLLGRMLEIVAEELEVPFFAARSTTFKSEALKRGLEPDECYYLTNAARHRPGELIDMTLDPPPDLAIEIEITSSLLDKIGVYEALRVPEIWRFDGERLRVLRLQADGTYVEIGSSVEFPFLPLDEIVRFVHEFGTSTDDLRWRKIFRTWVREVLIPRVRADQGEAPPA